MKAQGGAAMVFAPARPIGTAGIERGTAMTDAIEPKRLLFPGLAGLYERFSPYSYALIRFICREPPSPVEAGQALQSD